MKKDFDFKPLGAAIKAARVSAGYTRHKTSDILNISPRYLANIENKGQHPSIEILYELVTFFDVSVDQYFSPEKVETPKGPQYGQLLSAINHMSPAEIDAMLAVARALNQTKEQLLQNDAD